MKARDDNSRQIHQASVVGDNDGAEGAIPVTLDPKNARQAMPAQNVQNKGALFGSQYPFKGTPPSPDLTGDVPDAGVDPDDTSIDWGSVAPDTYPEKGDPAPTGGFPGLPLG